MDSGIGLLRVLPLDKKREQKRKKKVRFHQKGTAADPVETVLDQTPSQYRSLPLT